MKRISSPPSIIRNRIYLNQAVVNKTRSTKIIKLVEAKSKINMAIGWIICVKHKAKNNKEKEIIMIFN